MKHPRVGPLVRAVGPESAVIWTEWAHHCEATLHANAGEHSGEHETGVLTTRARTVTVGKRHFALLRLDGLQPSTWYDYHLTCKTDAEEQAAAPATSASKQCFRTLDSPEAGALASVLGAAAGTQCSSLHRSFLGRHASRAASHVCLLLRL